MHLSYHTPIKFHFQQDWKAYSREWMRFEIGLKSTLDFILSTNFMELVFATWKLVMTFVVSDVKSSTGSLSLVTE